MGERARSYRGMLLALALLTVLVIAALRTCSAYAGIGAVFKSAADRLLPTPQRTVWARCPDEGSWSGSYRDASGSGMNYVYDVEAAAEDGTHVKVTIIFFGEEASGEGWLEIDARGSSGVHYDGVAEDEVPRGARSALDDG